MVCIGEGRKVTKRTALDLAENNFDLMFEQLKELKSGKTIEKPIYNHVNGEASVESLETRRNPTLSSF